MARTGRARSVRGASRDLLGDRDRAPSRDDAGDRRGGLPGRQLDGPAAARDPAMRAGAGQDRRTESKSQGRPRGGDGGGADHGRGERSPDEQRRDEPEAEEDRDADDERTEHTRPVAHVATTPTGGADQLCDGEEAERDEARDGDGVRDDGEGNEQYADDRDGERDAEHDDAGQDERLTSEPDPEGSREPELDCLHYLGEVGAGEQQHADSDDQQHGEAAGHHFYR